MPQIVEHDVWHDKTPPKPLLPLSPYSKSTCNILFSTVKRCSKVKHSSWFICFQCFLFHKYVQYSMGITFDCWICFQNWRSQELPASYLLSQVCLSKSTRSDGRMAIDFVSFNLWSDTTYLQWYHLSREIRCHWVLDLSVLSTCCQSVPVDTSILSRGVFRISFSLPVSKWGSSFSSIVNICIT